MVMQSAFFKLADIIPIDEAVKYLKDAVEKSYGKKGPQIVEMNYGAIDKGIEALHKVEVPADWKDAKDEEVAKKNVPEFISDIQEVMNRQEGEILPVSKLEQFADGTFPLGGSQLLKFLAGIKINVSAVTSAVLFVRTRL